MKHCTPISVERTPAATSMPVSTRMSCLAPPPGYSVGTAITSMCACCRPSTAWRIAAMASGLLSSMPISTSSAYSSSRNTSAPRRMSAGALAHQQVVAGDVRLALGAVEHQRLDLVFVGIRLHVAGEYRAAQTDHAGLAQDMAQLGMRGLFVVHAAVCYPLILAVRDDGDAQVRQAGMVGDHLHVDGADRAGSGGVHRAGKASFRPADDLALEHALADLHCRYGTVAHMLVQRDDQFGGNRRLRDGRARRFGLYGWAGARRRGI